MAKGETTSGLELFLAVSRGAGVPLRSQLQDGIRTAIRQGILRPGTALPSSRALSRDLALSRGVVVDAYDQLAAEGYLSTARGWGPEWLPARPMPTPRRFRRRLAKPRASTFAPGCPI